ncbi:hypothetical protein UPYG_G00011980 [Umbra pygmaea]|uniref:Polyhomeotic-like protein 2 n=1 Tax=Umbra pygmaea TaxID=75934 RepID=A0ABD0XIZ7_UMBPY
MQNDAHGLEANSTSSSTTPSNTTVSANLVTTYSPGRATVPSISVYTGISDRQTVQVIQQALHRQPSTAAQYLQQMYAAQQQHIIMQTAALQQQQVQSHATVQQVQSHATVQQVQSHATVQQANMATPPMTAPLISRGQMVSSAPTCIPQQAMLLGNSSSPILTANQAQMYLRAQMLIFTPTAAVSTIQSETSVQSANNHQSASSQVQNPASCSQQGALSSQLQGTCVKQMHKGAQRSLADQLKSPTQVPQGAQLAFLDAPSEGGQKGESQLELSAHLVSMSSVTSVSSKPFISPAYSRIQTQQVLQQHEQQQFVFQQRIQPLPLRGQGPVLHSGSFHKHSQAQTLQTQAIQPQAMQGTAPVLPRLLVSAPVPNPQATVLHPTLSPQILSHNMPASVVTQKQAAPLPNANLVQQFRPTASTLKSQLVKDTAGEELPTPDVVTENSHALLVQQKTAPPALDVITSKPRPLEPCNPTTHTEAGTGDEERLNARPGAGSLPVMTSGNGNNAPTVTGSTPQNGESKPPQAIVKPQILMHVIEGFVIQEGAEPFPVERPLALLIENLKKQKEQTHFDSEKTTTSSNSTSDSDMEDLSQQELEQQEEPTLTCELCGRVDFASNFKRSKRFCSTVCAKRYNVGCTKRMGLFPNRQTTLENLKKQRTSTGNNQSSETKRQPLTTAQKRGGGLRMLNKLTHLGHGESSQCSDMSSYEGPPSPPLSAASSGAARSQVARGPEHTEGSGPEVAHISQHFLPSNPTRWNVDDVYEFICSLPGGLEIAEEFRSQEIDGQSLLLLKEDHLMGTMNIKLGPALKIFAHISMLRDS